MNDSAKARKYYHWQCTCCGHRCEVHPADERGDPRSTLLVAESDCCNEPAIEVEDTDDDE